MYQVDPESIDAVTTAITEFVAGIGVHEPDTLAYHAYQYLDDPTGLATP